MTPKKPLRVSLVKVSFKARKMLENSQRRDALDTPGIPKPLKIEKPKPLIAIM